MRIVGFNYASSYRGGGGAGGQEGGNRQEEAGKYAQVHHGVSLE